MPQTTITSNQFPTDVQNDLQKNNSYVAVTYYIESLLYYFNRWLDNEMNERKILNKRK
jgi:hypothetical protein